jgi:hypothetical protein
MSWAERLNNGKTEYRERAWLSAARAHNEKQRGETRRGKEAWIRFCQRICEHTCLRFFLSHTLSPFLLLTPILFLNVVVDLRACTPAKRGGKGDEPVVYDPDVGCTGGQER